MEQKEFSIKEYHEMGKKGLAHLENIRSVLGEFQDVYAFDGSEAGVYCCYPDRLNPGTRDECKAYLEGTQRSQFDLIQSVIKEAMDHTKDFDGFKPDNPDDLESDLTQYYQHFLNALDSELYQLDCQFDSIEDCTFLDDNFSNSIIDVWDWMNYLMEYQLADFEALFDQVDNLYSEYEKKLDRGEKLMVAALYTEAIEKLKE